MRGTKGEETLDDLYATPVVMEARHERPTLMDETKREVARDTIDDPLIFDGGAVEDVRQIALDETLRDGLELGVITLEFDVVETFIFNSDDERKDEKE